MQSQSEQTELRIQMDVTDLSVKPHLLQSSDCRDEWVPAEQACLPLPCR